LWDFILKSKFFSIEKKFFAKGCSSEPLKVSTHVNFASGKYLAQYKALYPS
jgi:hypothetical protein